MHARRHSLTHLIYELLTRPLTQKVPAATVAAWGGAGTVVEVRLSEQLAHLNKHEVCPVWRLLVTLITVCVLYINILYIYIIYIYYMHVVFGAGTG